MVMEMQLVMEFSATVFATIGMAFGGFKEMVRKRTKFSLKDRTVYWTVAILANVATWQLCFATPWMVYLTPVSPRYLHGGVTSYECDWRCGDVRRCSGGVKIVSTVLCVWGFSSYVYGIYVKMKKDEEKEEEEEEEGHTGMKRWKTGRVRVGDGYD
ncbi:hypothetical protein Bca52824_064590 [Brassica carinata]|uniref:Uncharacterized protein n=1 Tax=Brassica carinata TaxID=52824 RepID=A0A8X7QGT7_BRACI|nr:hypothetical protein Bca52824_064590 [Brassica carinata]